MIRGQGNHCCSLTSCSRCALLLQFVLIAWSLENNLLVDSLSSFASTLSSSTSQNVFLVAVLVVLLWVQWETGLFWSSVSVKTGIGMGTALPLTVDGMLLAEVLLLVLPVGTGGHCRGCLSALGCSSEISMWDKRCGYHFSYTGTWHQSCVASPGTRNSSPKSTRPPLAPEGKLCPLAAGGGSPGWHFWLSAAIRSVQLIRGLGWQGAVLCDRHQPRQGQPRTIPHRPRALR